MSDISARVLLLDRIVGKIAAWALNVLIARSAKRGVEMDVKFTYTRASEEAP